MRYLDIIQHSSYNQNGFLKYVKCEQFGKVKGVWRSKKLMCVLWVGDNFVGDMCVTCSCMVLQEEVIRILLRAIIEYSLNGFGVNYVFSFFEKNYYYVENNVIKLCQI